MYQLYYENRGQTHLPSSYHLWMMQQFSVSADVRLRYFYTTYIHYIPLVGVQEERRIKSWSIVKPEKVAPVRELL